MKSHEKSESHSIKSILHAFMARNDGRIFDFHRKNNSNWWKKSSRIDHEWSLQWLSWIMNLSSTRMQNDVINDDVIMVSSRFAMWTDERAWLRSSKCNGLKNEKHGNFPRNEIAITEFKNEIMKRFWDVFSRVTMVCSYELHHIRQRDMLNGNSTILCNFRKNQYTW